MVPEKELAGRVIDISAKGMRLVLDQPIPLSTPLRIDGFNTMFLGEACHCVPVEGKWQVGIQLEHYVANVEELAALTLNRI